MSAASAWVAACAAPRVSQPPGAVALLAGAFFEAVLRRLDRRVDQADARRLFNATLRDRIGRIPAGGRCWTPEIGAVLAGLSRGDQIESVVCAILAAQFLGEPVTWAATLPRRARFSFSGHTFDLEGEVSGASAAGRMTLRRGDQSLDFESDGLKRWRVGAAPSRFRCVQPAWFQPSGHEMKFVQAWREDVSGGGEDFMVDWPPEPQDATFDGLPERAAHALQGAVAGLAELSPAYPAWLDPLFRGVAASHVRAPGTTQSGSYTWHAGVFSCGFPVPTEALGEVIVHEVSHQYYLLLNAAVPLVSGDPTAEYYSPLKGRPRPIGRIILSFHAAANMALYWRDVVDLRGRTDERVLSLRRIRSHAVDLLEQVRRAGEVSPAGRELVELQAALLADAGLLEPMLA